MKKYNFPAGTSPTRSMFARNVSDTINYQPLVADTASRVAIPEGAKYVEVITDQPLFAKFGNSTVTVVAPSAAVTNGSSALPVKNGDVLLIPTDATVTHVSLIAAANAKVSLGYFA